ncbi:MAG: cytochrome c3 family protein [Tepidisphaeraceae bacterium]
MKPFLIATFGLMAMLAVESAGAGPATRPAKPTTVTESSGCTTADCHGSVKQYKFMHGPVNSNTCDACHKLTEPKTHAFEITRQKAELCTFCHEFSTGTMPVIHQPVLTGQCLGCHNPHGGPAPSMMREQSMADLCGRCHDLSNMSKRFMHKPVQDGQCDACHQPHASKYPKLVDAAGADLCNFCHKNFKTQMANVKFQHMATEKSCGECHDAHGSDYPKHIIASLPDLCLRCHEKVKHDTATAVYKHPAVMGDRACMTCHTAHGGDLASLMSGLPIKVCMTCHNEPIKNARGKVVAAVPEINNAANFRHGPVRDGQCGGCHNIHGGDRPLLLQHTNAQEFYQKFSEKNYELCFSCHDPMLTRDEREGTYTGFRNGELNLHYIHVNDKQHNRNCGVCHGVHATRQEQDIRDSVPYGKWQLPIEYKKTGTGGSCQTGCHANWAYDRENPAPRPREASPAPIRPSASPREPVLAQWSGKDLAGAEVRIPDAGKPTVLLFLRADQPQSEHVARMAAAAVKDAARAKVLVILSGPQAGEHAQSLVKSKTVAWPIVADTQSALSAKLGVFSWPATLVVGSDASVLAHVAGAPLSLTADLAGYLEFAGGRIDRSELNRQLASRAVVSDGPAQRATWHLQMATKLLAEGKLEDARSLLSDGLKLAPEMAAMRIALVDTLVQLKQLKPAVEVLNKAPENSLLPWQQNLLLAKIAIANGQWPQAKRLLTGVLKEKSDLSEAHYLMGRIHEHDGDWQSAAGEYRTAREGK